jgi:hypothetical protein
LTYRAYLREFPDDFYVLSLCSQAFLLAIDCAIHDDEQCRSCTESGLSEGSQSGIDLNQIVIALANATPQSNTERSRGRGHARGKCHRRRYFKTHVSRSSVYETIESFEERQYDQTAANYHPRFGHSINLRGVSLG